MDLPKPMQLICRIGGIAVPILVIGMLLVLERMAWIEEVRHLGWVQGSMAAQDTYEGSGEAYLLGAEASTVELAERRIPVKSWPLLPSRHSWAPMNWLDLEGPMRIRSQAFVKGFNARMKSFIHDHSDAETASGAVAEESQ